MAQVPECPQHLQGRFRMPHLWIERFLDMVAFEPNTGCWVWTGQRSLVQKGTGKRRAHLGYGQFKIGGRYRSAHRLAFEYFKGMIPENLECDHLCRAAHCVNPDHIELVTHSENVRRGTCPQQIRQRQTSKTECPLGHPYDHANTYTRSNGARYCRKCGSIRERRRRLNGPRIAAMS